MSLIQWFLLYLIYVSIFVPFVCLLFDLGNLARGKNTKQSSTGYGGDSKRAVDGNKNNRYGGRSCTHTNRQTRAWWRVDLGSIQKVGNVKITNRGDCCDDRLKNFDIRVGNTDNNPRANGL